MIGTILAHGIGGRTDLPLPAWQLAWAAGFSVAISFVALGAFWEKPLLEAAARGRAVLTVGAAPARVGGAVLKLIGLFLFGVVLYAAWFGNTNFAVNIAGDAFLIWFWVGLQFVSAVFGDVWRAFNPYLTIADAGAWLRSRLTSTPMSDVTHGETSLWPATIAIFSYLWFELAYRSLWFEPDGKSAADPRAIAVYLTIYSVVMLVGAAVRGRGWVRTADGFAVLFTKLAAMAVFWVERTDEGRRLRIRPPLAGLATLPSTVGLVPFVIVVLGSTTFDGFTRSSLWFDIAGDRVGWGLTVTHTIGLLAIVLVVGLAYVFAVNLMADTTGDPADELSAAFGPTLVPIAAAYAVAHYFSLLVLDGQRMFIQISDPLGRGWDLFGTKDYEINWVLVSPSTIAWVQTLAIAVGHVLAVAAAHDRAISRYHHHVAVRSQYPMLGVMIAYTVAGLFLLLGA